MQSLPAAEPPLVLERDRRLSQSLLWRLQRGYFAQHGIRAWSQGTVPHYITSNPFIAHAYARVVFGFLRDCRSIEHRQHDPDLPALDPEQPVYLIELGAGSGRFAFHFLRKLLDLQRRAVLKIAPFKYVMTDFAEQNMDFWRTHPALRPYVEQGVLDFACFDAERDQDFRLEHSATTLGASTKKHPLVVIANYFFDSIPQDLFYVEDGHLYERLITLSSSQAEKVPDDPELLNRFTIAYENRPAPTDYYDDPDWNRILQDYRQRWDRLTFLFPSAALQCIRHLRRLSDGRMLLLSGDKGDDQEAALLNWDEPQLNLHGSFSLMVNYHAIGQYIQNQGEQVLHVAPHYNHLNICAFLFGPHPGDYSETRLAFSEAIEHCGPDDFYTLNKGIAKNSELFTLEQLLSFLRLSGWDAKLFKECFPVLLNQVDAAPASLQRELSCALQQIWENYYHIGEECDLAFYLAMLFYGLQDYPKAQDYFQHSLRLWGPNPSTFYNQAMCYYTLSQMDAARECLNQALLLDPTFAAAQTMRLKLQSEIGAAGS